MSVRRRLPHLATVTLSAVSVSMAVPSAQDVVSARVVVATAAVLEQPQAGASHVLLVPAAVVVELLVQSGDWYEVALTAGAVRDGRPAGWIDRRDIEELPGQRARASELPQAVSVGPEFPFSIPPTTPAAAVAGQEVRQPSHSASAGCSVAAAGPVQELMTSGSAAAFLLADDNQAPLVTLPRGRRVRRVALEGDWVLARFDDEQWGERAAYLRCSSVRPLPAGPPGKAPSDVAPGMRSRAAGARPA